MMELRHARFHRLCPTSGLCDGLVNQELLLQNEYLLAENRILRAHVHGEFIVQAAMGSDTTLRILPFAMRQASAMGMNARYGSRSLSRTRSVHSVLWSATRVGDWSFEHPAPVWSKYSCGAAVVPE